MKLSRVTPLLKTAKILSLSLAIGASAGAATIDLQQGVNGYTGTTDTSIYEELPGNSAGGFPGLFAGITQFGDARRALIRFDFTGILPPNATVTSVSLHLQVDRAQFTPIQATAHRLTRAWNEGNNPKPAFNEGGLGAPAQPGDTTWSHVSYDTVAWATPGGEFVITPSGEGTSREAGTVTIIAGAGMVADVQQWISTPAENHGWIILAGENGNQNAKRFISSESTDSRRPRLHIEYTAPSAVYGWELYQ